MSDEPGGHGRAGALRGGRVPAFARVLCAVDGKRGGFESVRQAAAIAGARGHLTLLAVTSYRVEGAYRSPALGPLETKRILDEAVRIAKDAGVPCTAEADPASPPSRVILDWSAGHDLLALGAPASSWLGGMFVAGVGDSAVGALTTPLLVARATGGQRHVAERILVASDAREGSDGAVELAARMAQTRRAGVTLLHATGHGTHIRRRRFSEEERKLEQQRRWLEAADVGPSELRVEPGSPHEVIVAAAERAEASVVVMGSRGLNGLSAIGSVSRRVVHEAHCSVLLVPPAWAAGARG